MVLEFAEDRGCSGEGSSVSRTAGAVAGGLSSQGRTDLGIKSLGPWRKTRLSTVSATLSLLSAVTLGSKVTAESSVTVSPVAREQLQKRRLEGLSCTIPSSGGNAGTGGKNLGCPRLPLLCSVQGSSWLPVPEETLG